MYKRLQTLAITSFAFLAFSISIRADLPPPLPRPAVSFGATVCDGWVYLYGGSTGKAHEFNRDCIMGDCFRWSIANGSAWELMPSGEPLLGAILVTWEGKIIRIGGMSARNAKGEKNELYSTNDVAAFDPAKQTWTPMPALPEPRSSHDAVVFDGTLYVGGGWLLTGDEGDGVHATWHKTLLSLDLHAPEKGWTSIPQPFERRAMAMVLHKGRIWFLGGMNSNDQQIRSVDWFEPLTGTWGRGPDLPEGPMAGFGAAACIEDGQIFVSPLSGKVLSLSADEKQWDSVAQLNPVRFFHRLLPLGEGRLAAIGGSNREGHVTKVEVVTSHSVSARTVQGEVPTHESRQ